MCTVADLSLAVALRIVWGGKVVLDPVLLAEGGYFLAGEVGPVIRDDGVGYTEASDNVYPKETNNLLDSDLR